MISINRHIDLLGKRVKDRVTGFKGVVTSVGFDLYGCVQILVVPEISRDGKYGDSIWFDVGRLDVESQTPVMERPQFEWTAESISAGKKGPAEKPAFRRP